MATLGNSDFEYIRDWIQVHPSVWATFKAWSISRPTWKLLLQASEDYMVSAFNNRPATSYKAALDAVSTTTGAQAQAIFYAWVSWKMRNLGG
jgi:hypothetical protein